MPIQFACPYCETISSVPDSFAGKQGKCPSCRKVIEVPDPNAAADADTEAPRGNPRDGPRDASADPRDSGRPRVPVSGDHAGNTKTCKFCGETVKRIAKKCKFCGEFFDKAVQRRGPRPPSHMMLAIGSIIFCCWPVTIAAMVFAAQVDSKHASGDYEGARKASQTARTLALTAMGLSVFAALALFVLSLA